MVEYTTEGSAMSGGVKQRGKRGSSSRNVLSTVIHLLPVKAIQRAYLVASRRQCDATSSPQVTVREMMPIMMKKSVVTHSGGSRGGIQVRSRPWMV